jgi:hypothetical protein
MNGSIELTVKNIHHRDAEFAEGCPKYLFSPSTGEN